MQSAVHVEQLVTHHLQERCELCIDALPIWKGVALGRAPRLRASPCDGRAVPARRGSSTGSGSAPAAQQPRPFGLWGGRMHKEMNGGDEGVVIDLVELLVVSSHLWQGSCRPSRRSKARPIGVPTHARDAEGEVEGHDMPRVAKGHARSVAALRWGGGV